MNDIFDIRRFGWYARKEFRENWKVYALFAVGVVVMQLVFIYLLCKPLEDKFYYDQLKGYDLNPFAGLFNSAVIATWIAGSYAYSYFSSSSKTLFSLTLPVSPFERFCFAWLLTIPLSLIITAILWRVTWLFATPFILSTFPKVIIRMDYAKAFRNVVETILAIGVLGISGTFMLGSVIFRKYSFFKTLAIGVGTVLLLYTFQQKALTAILPNADKVETSPYPGFIYASVRTISKLHLQFGSTFELPYLVWWVGCLPVILWVVTYLKIKEKEV
ncbi:hypothetical protein [Runella zeae]|uniref:hypothetical protein n=1 Tax=Runella zeae TaxID=94255 RepID=UPI0004176649|nr:hypothetical protein [Runella zeae]